MDSSFTLIFSDIRIKWYDNSPDIDIMIDYARLSRNSVESNTGVVYSTKVIPGNVNGFLQLPNRFYIKVTIYRESLIRLKPSDLKSCKIEINNLSSTIKFSIVDKKFFSKRVARGKYEKTLLLESPSLKDLYMNVVITADLKELEANLITLRDIEKVSKLIAKDTVRADRFQYDHVPNTDGNRNRHEYFAGTGSNIGKGR
ncbi:hypothetical protein V7201_06300 [Bacillus sp. JJ1122]|uniref:hypothetical protein n=1 Tax=Bacillus sp. JJ1122 TaxID=3122951 RepID=UPI003000AFDC